MTNEQWMTAHTMMTYGGSFVACLGRAMMCADPGNLRRVEVEWPEYMREYGPTTQLYKKAEKEYFGR